VSTPSALVGCWSVRCALVPSIAFGLVGLGPDMRKTHPTRCRRTTAAAAAVARSKVWCLAARTAAETVWRQRCGGSGSGWQWRQ
jgi:hypothetical protein